MATSIELIIDFEEPSVHIQVVCNELGQRKHEFLLVIDVD